MRHKQPSSMNGLVMIPQHSVGQMIFIIQAILCCAAPGSARSDESHEAEVKRPRSAAGLSLRSKFQHQVRLMRKQPSCVRMITARALLVLQTPAHVGVHRSHLC